MIDTAINFPESVFIDSYHNWHFDENNYLNNIINIDGVDYIPYFLNKDFKRSKGGNSAVIALHEAQTFEDEGFENPNLALKISNYYQKPRTRTRGYQRFINEVETLIACLQHNHSNIVKIFHKGIATIEYNNRECKFPYYTMEYASNDLKSFIELDILV